MALVDHTTTSYGNLVTEVSEVKEIKHAFRSGIKAQQGIEF